MLTTVSGDPATQAPAKEHWQTLYKDQMSRSLQPEGQHTIRTVKERQPL